MASRAKVHVSTKTTTCRKSVKCKHIIAPMAILQWRRRYKSKGKSQDDTSKDELEETNRLRDVSILRKKLSLTSFQSGQGAAPGAGRLQSGTTDAFGYTDTHKKSSIRRSNTIFGESTMALPVNTTGFANDTRMFTPSAMSFSALAASGYGNGYDSNTFVRSFRQNHLTSNLLMQNRQDRMMEDRKWMNSTSLTPMANTTRQIGTNVVHRTSQCGWSVITVCLSIATGIFLRKCIMFITENYRRPAMYVKRLLSNLYTW